MKKLFTFVMLAILLFAGCSKSGKADNKDGSLSIKEKGITVDYSIDKPNSSFEIYIDGTKYYFRLNISLEDQFCDIMLANMLDNNSAEVRQYNSQGKNINSAIIDLENLLSESLISWKVERRDVNTISAIVVREITKTYK